MDLSELRTNTKDTRKKKQTKKHQPEESPEEGTEEQKIKLRANASFPNTRKCSTVIKKQSTNNKRNCVILLWKSLSKTQMQRQLTS